MLKKLFIVFVALLLVGCGKEYHTIDAEAAKEMMDTKDVLILDVRTESEYDSGHIEGAINLPLDQIEDLYLEVIGDKNTVLLVYCRSGNRSQTASEKLSKLGYKEVYNFGGINNWPYEIVN